MISLAEVSHSARAAGVPARDCRHVLGMRVDALDYAAASEAVLGWAAQRQSRYVCVANVHMVMEAHDDAAFRRLVNESDLVTPDGVPLVWSLRLLGAGATSRVYGPALTSRICREAARRRIPVGFLGGSPIVIERLCARLASESPDLEIAYACSPPFRPLTPAEDQQIVDDINGSGARILFVGLGCPKQERWMAGHRAAVGAVMLGVGAAFDFIAGTKRQAPSVLQNLGLEWAFRFVTEPRRLWKRYAYNNPRFLLGLARQLLGRREHGAVT